jgi:hypothetical protein
MQPDPLPDAPPKSFVHLVGRGLAYGALAGVVSAEIYIVGLTAVDFIFGDPWALVGILLGQIFGVLPAAIVGAVSGAVIGTVFFCLGDRLSPQTGGSWGLLIAGLMALPFVLLILTSPDMAPALMIGMPIVVLYLPAGAWGGNKLTGGTFRISSAQRKALLVLLAAVGVLVLGRAVVALVFHDHQKVVTREVRPVPEAAWPDTECQELGFEDSLALEIVEFPGYEVQICTDGAARYLRENPASGTLPAEFVVHYNQFQFKDFEVRKIGGWAGRGKWHFTGTLPCITIAGDTECGGKKSQAATDLVFGYFH